MKGWRICEGCMRRKRKDWRTEEKSKGEGWRGRGKTCRVHATWRRTCRMQVLASFPPLPFPSSFPSPTPFNFFSISTSTCFSCSFVPYSTSLISLFLSLSLSSYFHFHPILPSPQSLFHMLLLWIHLLIPLFHLLFLISSSCKTFIWHLYLFLQFRLVFFLFRCLFV